MNCSILTTTPNAVTSSVHDRMPVILDQDNYDLWLDPGMQDASAAPELLRPYGAQFMRRYVFDACPEILTLPRSDCATCFAGDTSETYPLMVQLAYAIAAHEPARDRSMDISRVKDHLLRVFTDLIRALKDTVTPITSSDAQFIFAGYPSPSVIARIVSTSRR